VFFLTKPFVCNELKLFGFLCVKFCQFFPKTLLQEHLYKQGKVLENIESKKRDFLRFEGEGYYVW